MASVETSTTALVEEIFERLDDRDPAISDFMSDDVVELWPIVGRLDGPQAVSDHFSAIFAAMPDFRIAAERIAAEGDTVFVHWHITGTFTGKPFFGFDPTGRPIDLRGTDCFTIHDGKVVENFIAFDGMTFATQAGILPEHGSRADRAMTAAVNVITRLRKTLHRRG